MLRFYGAHPSIFLKTAVVYETCLRSISCSVLRLARAACTERLLWDDTAELFQKPQLEPLRVVTLRQNQVQVSEFVPEVALLQRLMIGDFEMFQAGEGFQHGEVGCTWLVQAGEQSIDCTQSSLWRDEQICPAFTRVSYAFYVGNSFEGADDCCADGDNTFTS